MDTFTATISITAVLAETKDRYGKVETPSQYQNLLEITVTAGTLEKLQEKVHAHIDLVEGRDAK